MVSVRVRKVSDVVGKVPDGVRKTSDGARKMSGNTQSRGVVCESDRFRETSIKVESGVLESDMRPLKNDTMVLENDMMSIKPYPFRHYTF